MAFFYRVPFSLTLFLINTVENNLLENFWQELAFYVANG